MIETDPWRFLKWAFATTTGNSTRKAVLTALATMAEMNTGRCEAKQETLAQWVEAGERAVRGHLRVLEEEGLIARRPQFRRDRGRRGDEFLMLAPGVTEWPDGEAVHPANTAGGGGTNGYLGRGTDPTGQEQPPMNNHASKQEEAPARNARNDPREVPDGFPDELRPHANAVLSLLREAAVERGAKAVTVRAVGRVVMDHPRKPLVAAAQSMRAWLLDGNGASAPCKDVVMRYRKWLGGEQDLAAPERLDERGHPTASVMSVSTRRGGVESPRDRQLRERQAQADRDGPAMKAVLAQMGIGDANRRPTELGTANDD